MMMLFIFILYLPQESFYPVEVTEGHWIVPEWRSPPVRLSQIIFLKDFMGIVSCHL